MRRQNRILGGIVAILLLAEATFFGYALSTPSSYQKLEREWQITKNELSDVHRELKNKWLMNTGGIADIVYQAEEAVIKTVYPRITNLNEYNGWYRPLERLKLSKLGIPPKFAEDALYDEGSKKCKRRNSAKQITCNYLETQKRK